MVGRAATIRLEKISPETGLQRWWVHTYGRISYLAILHGDIKVNADKYPLVFEINVGNGEFVGERHADKTIIEGGSFSQIIASYLSTRHGARRSFRHAFAF